MARFGKLLVLYTINEPFIQGSGKLLVLYTINEPFIQGSKSVMESNSNLWLFLMVI